MKTFKQVLSNDELLEIAYNNEIQYHDIEKSKRRKKRMKKGYKCN